LASHDVPGWHVPPQDSRSIAARSRDFLGRERATPDPDGEHRAAPAMAVFGAPMPLSSCIARPPTPPVRSHDAATTCRVSGGTRGPRRGRKKVAQSGRIRAFFEHPYTGGVGGVKGRDIHRPSSVTCHHARLASIRPISSERVDRRPSSAPSHTLRYSGRASPAPPPRYRPMSWRARDL
jgi:hypothetical protein